MLKYIEETVNKSKGTQTSWQGQSCYNTKQVSSLHSPLFNYMQRSNLDRRLSYYSFQPFRPIGGGKGTSWSLGCLTFCIL